MTHVHAQIFSRFLAVMFADTRDRVAAAIVRLEEQLKALNQLALLSYFRQEYIVTNKILKLATAFRPGIRCNSNNPCGAPTHACMLCSDQCFA